MDTSALLDQLNCCICLNIYRDPVALRCGHSFCRVCITSVLETQKPSGVYKCPRCRKRFQEEPSVQENISLRHIADHLLSTQPKQEQTGILCNYCIHSQVPAVKTCVLCEASLCDNHVRVHSKSAEHILTDPTTSLESKKCSVHNEILKYFCSDDNVCICVSCSLVGDHKGHPVEILPEAAVKMKETLKEVLEQLTSSKTKTEGRLQTLQKTKTTVPETAANMKEKVAALLKNIREQLDELEKKAMSQISTQEENALKSVSDLIQKLEEDREDLAKEIADTEELCEMTDPLSVLQACETDMDEVEKHEDNITDDQVYSAGKLDEGLVSEHLHIGFCNILNDMKKHLQIHEITNITLDANTASNNVLLSNDYKSACKNNQDNHCYESPQRFKHNAQVLSLESFGGQCYWDVDTERSNYWIIGMSYSSIAREGSKSWIGSNNKSWGLHKAGYTYKVRHNDKEISLLGNFGQGQRFRVYLDYVAGHLSFYELSDQIRHIHTFTATFTDSLHIALCVYDSRWIRIII
ncbi:PREDICTED: E3 ubiquitin/ISG15 ligase TRIM25-like [Nanorana parkeri]|uniref:E3 ubiquitin/ISG15 ligase TRIM25-like n=1 Tax=Nanorana parkeri TaxID=125878 RepID=UPI00085413DD|nr:PREDICTED: E3 ubiquitin/ISG15 ligase TRIM25-like [Nanorana parkeri]